MKMHLMFVLYALVYVIAITFQNIGTIALCAMVSVTWGLCIGLNKGTKKGELE